MIFENLDRIVFAGDSVTDMGRVFPIGEGSFDCTGKGYVSVVNNMLSAYYPEVAVRVTNVGTSGNTSRDLLARFDNDVVNLNPDWVSICIGINDVWRYFDSPASPDVHVTLDEYEKNLEEMILRVKDKVKGIFILTPYYMMEPNAKDEMRAMMEEYVAVCYKLAEKHGCRLVDFHKMFAEYCTKRHSSFLAWDRIHPNMIGATLMAREFLKHCDFDYNH